VFHFRTATPYGISELEDVYGAQNLLTKEIATLAAATEGYRLAAACGVEQGRHTR